MPETTQTQREVAELTTRVASIEHMVRFSLASSSEAKAHAATHFRSKKNSAELYLALGQPKSQDELRKALNLSAGSISMLCSHLEEEGFISRDKSATNKKVLVFRWNEVEGILRLSRIAKLCVKSGKK